MGPSNILSDHVGPGGIFYFIFIQYFISKASRETVGTEPRVSLKAGTEASLPCKVTTKVNAVFWSRGSDSSRRSVVALILHENVHDRIWPVEDKVSFNISEDFSLIINNVSVEKEGQYICEVEVSATRTMLSNSTIVSVYGMFPYVF